MHKLSLGLIGGGAMALALSVLLGWMGFPQLIRSMIKKTSKLERGTPTFKTWSSPGDTMEVFLKVYFFNVSNPKDFQNGGKPRVEEIGPYVYSEKRYKTGIEPGELGDTLRYRQKVYLNFLRDFSSGSDEDLVTFLNIPLVAMAKMANALTDDDFILSQFDSMLMEKEEKLFRTEPVRKLLLDGFSVKNFLDILSDPLVAATVGEVPIPASFSGGTFAIYKGKNGSDDGLYEVKTGQLSYKDFGQIHKWNNKTSLPWWKDPTCNSLDGTTDGTIFRPFLLRHNVLRSFSPDLCRSIDMKFEEDIVYKGIPGFRFAPVPETMQGPHKNPANKCFCREKDLTLCNRNGLALLAGCKESAPVSLSSPHFYNADPAIQYAVYGIRPMKEKHKTFIDIQPTTGVMMRAAKRLQFNVDVVPYSSMPTFEKVKKVAFPIMWAEESTELPEELLKLLMQLHNTQYKVETARWSMVGVSLACFCLGILWMILQKGQGEKRPDVNMISNGNKY